MTKRILFLCSCHKYDYNINREKSKEEKRGKREKKREWFAKLSLLNVDYRFEVVEKLMNTPSFYKHFFSSLLYFFPSWSCTSRWDKLVQRHQIDLVVGLRSVFVKILIHLETSFRTGINAKRKKNQLGYINVVQQPQKHPRNPDETVFLRTFPFARETRIAECTLRPGSLIASRGKCMHVSVQK